MPEKLSLLPFADVTSGIHLASALLRHPVDEVSPSGHRQPGSRGDKEAAGRQSEGGCIRRDSGAEGKSVKKLRCREILRWSPPLLAQPSISVSNDSHLVPVCLALPHRSVHWHTVCRRSAAEKWPVWPMIIVRTSTTLAHMSSTTPIDPSHPFSNESLSFLDTHLIIEQRQAVLIFSIVWKIPIVEDAFDQV